MPSVYVKTLGCKVNTFDSHALENQLADSGMVLAADHYAADVLVLNTCSVTAAAEKQARYLMRRFKRDNPDAKLVVTGCYAQTNSARIGAISEVDLVVPNEIKHDLASLVTGLGQGASAKLPDRVKPVTDNRQTHFKSSVTLFDRADSTQSRAFVKIQDGCNGFCTYCLIPYARGASKSVPKAAVMAEMRRLVKSGSLEIVLSGIHLGDYGQDLPADDFPADCTDRFAATVEEILALPGMTRLRISSLEPMEISTALLDVLARHRDRVCPHFHIPLQSGCDRILKLMRRQYDAATYAATIKRIREYFPQANIGADIIPGFPSETDLNFDESVAFVERVGLNYLHVFPYSSRPNTAAAKMPGHLPPQTVKARAARLREISDALAMRYATAQLGRTEGVVWKRQPDADGRAVGTTRNYLKVTAPVAAAIDRNREQGLKLKGFFSGKLILGLPLGLNPANS